MLGKKELSFISLLLIILSCMAFFSIRSISNTEVKTDDYSSRGNPTTGITRDLDFSQTFRASNDGLTSVSLMFGTFRRVNNSSIFVRISDDENSEILYDGSLNSAQLPDGDAVEFVFPPVKRSRNHTYTIEVTSDADDANAVALWTNSALINTPVVINGMASSANLSYIAKYRNISGESAAVLATVLGVLIAAACAFLTVGAIKKERVLLKNIMLLSGSVTAAAAVTEAIYIVLLRSPDPIYGFIEQPAVFFEALAVILLAVYMILGHSSDISSAVHSSAIAAVKKAAAVLYAAAVVLSAILMVQQGKDGMSVRSSALAAFIVGIIFPAALLILNRKLNAFAKSFVKEKSDTAGALKQKSRIGFAVYICSEILTGAAVILLPAAFWFYSDAAVIAVYVYAAVLFAFRLLNALVNHGENIDFAKLFFTLSIITGFVFAFCDPLSSRITFDDQIHYSSSVKAVHFITGTDITEADVFIGSTAMGTPDTITQRAEVFDRMADMGTNMIPYTDTGSLKMSTYSYLGYAPVIVCLMLQRLINAPYYIFIILSRFANAAVYSVVLYLGIRKLRSGQLIFSALALCPELVLIAANYSYDFWVTAFIGYGIAGFLSICQDKERKITVPDMIKIALAFFIGCGPKAIYFVLILPFVFLHKSKYRSSSDRKLFVSLCIITASVIAVTFVLPFFSDSSQSTDLRGGEGIDSSAQLRYILTEPAAYLKTLVSFLGDYMSLYYSGLNVSSYAYLGNAASWSSSAILMILLFAVFMDKNKYDDFDNNIIIRSALAVTSLGAIILASTALYISFTPVGHTWINGMQWRYQAPALFGLLYSFGSVKTRCGLSNRVKALIVYGGIFATTFLSYHSAYITVIAG